MEDYAHDFLQLALARKVLRFGEFTLKSGRVSPYFFNAGLFDSGAALARLGQYYAAAIQASNVAFDVLFGPAYKGIPLAAVTAAALYNDYAQDVPYAFNRKEPKAHGEGGRIVGAPLRGRVAIIDDVITAGTAIRESAAIIASEGAELAGVFIALDRQEVGQGTLSAVQEVEHTFGVPVVSIANVEQLLQLLEQSGQRDALDQLKSYQARYGTHRLTPEAT